MKTYTIGMAGHIDHGKTTLTKALTNIDTDRLKEEKARNISIEPGFAPLYVSDETKVSIIDVPGHERFIRQMIAGVAGIDGVILTVAADEGVMPQTKEHLAILSLLGVKGGLIAVTKIDNVEEDLLELAAEEIRKELRSTPFEHSPMLYVDSISKKGLDPLKNAIESMLDSVPVREAKGAFRLPIDQVFTVHGQGTVVRGTVYEGSVQEHSILTLLPQQQRVNIRQLQVHGEKVNRASAGQRLALNISGVPKEEISRGDVLVSAEHYITTYEINIVLYTSSLFSHALKQRGAIKLHLGTAEVFGKIVFFDRNVLETGSGMEVLCQLRLDEPVVTKRGDRFILRRPSPMETIGGGWVINPAGGELRFGNETIHKLEKEMTGTPEEHIKQALIEEKWLTVDELAKATGLPMEETEQNVEQLHQSGEVLVFSNGKATLRTFYESFTEEIISELKSFHDEHPLRYGKNKEELRAVKYKKLPKDLFERFLEKAEKEKIIIKNNQFISMCEFEPHFPKGWEKRMQQVLNEWKSDGIQVQPWTVYCEEQGLPAGIVEEWKRLLLGQGEAVSMDDKHLWCTEAFEETAARLKKETQETFTLQEAKEALVLSRKFLVPLLEEMDKRKRTKREGETRKWLI
ncbi:selenocysteine-specific translation elongation factor [Alteribacillus sp. HJP-4]|uniref:selenocysteine-specific translation elongation factor n=1 Tax=Alteribacillus sp. HJP-4 TaxID=2775394 RepID=UPI0035CD0E78